MWGGREAFFFYFKRLGLFQQRFSGDAAFSTSEPRGEKPSAQRNKGWMGFKKGKACARLYVQELWDGKFRPRAENGISGRVKGCSRLGSLIFGRPWWRNALKRLVQTYVHKCIRHPPPPPAHTDQTQKCVTEGISISSACLEFTTPMG